MIVSIHHNPPDTGYHVWLNGKIVDKVFAACDNQGDGKGWVTKARVGANGKEVIAFGSDYIEREVVYGNVTIINTRLLPVPA